MSSNTKPPEYHNVVIDKATELAIQKIWQHTRENATSLDAERHNKIILGVVAKVVDLANVQMKTMNANLLEARKVAAAMKKKVKDTHSQYEDLATRVEKLETQMIELKGTKCSEKESSPDSTPEPSSPPTKEKSPSAATTKQRKPRSSSFGKKTK